MHCVRGASDYIKHVNKKNIDIILKYVFPILDSAIEERMEVLMGPSAVSKPVGETVLLPCVVKGFPLPVIRWMRSSKVIGER